MYSELRLPCEKKADKTNTIFSYNIFPVKLKNRKSEESVTFLWFRVCKYKEGKSSFQSKFYRKLWHRKGKLVKVEGNLTSTPTFLSLQEDSNSLWTLSPCLRGSLVKSLGTNYVWCWCASFLWQVLLIFSLPWQVLSLRPQYDTTNLNHSYLLYNSNQT